MQDVTVHNERPQIAVPNLQRVVQLLLNLNCLSPFGYTLMGCGLPLQLYRQRFIDFLERSVACKGEDGPKDRTLDLHVGPLVALIQMMEEALVHGIKLGKGVVVEARACNSTGQGREGTDNRDEFVDDIVGDP
jgi:hypothetical protein